MCDLGWITLTVMKKVCIILALLCLIIPTSIAAYSTENHNQSFYPTTGTIKYLDNIEDGYPGPTSTYRRVSTYFYPKSNPVDFTIVQVRYESNGDWVSKTLYDKSGSATALTLLDEGHEHNYYVVDVTRSIVDRGQKK